MNDHRPTELELSAALRAHLPAAAGADLRDRINLATAIVPQQRVLPSVLGALTDADPIGRQRALLVAAALLVAVALAGAAVVGALNDRDRNPLPLGGQGPLAFVRQGDLFLANPDGSSAVPVAHVDGAELSDPQWSSDGRYIAVQTPEPAILLFDARSGALRRLVAGSIGAWSPDGSSLAYLATNGDVGIIDVESGESRTVASRPDGTEGYNRPFAWSPDGQWIAMNGPGDASDKPGRLVRTDVATGAIEVLDEQTDYYQYQPDWSPESDRVVVGLYAERRLSDHLSVTPVDGTRTSEIFEPGASILEPDWSPDGEWIAYVSLSRADRPDQLMIVRPDGTGARLLATEVAGIVGWSPDGASLSYTAGAWDSEERELHVVTIADGADRVVSMPGGGADFAFATSPQNAATDAVLPSLRGWVALGPPEAPIEAPPAGPPLEPDASWGGMVFRTAVGEFDCYLGVLRFPDQFTVIDPQRAGPPPEAPGEEPGPGTPKPQQADYCELPAKPDGSAVVRASQRDASFDIARLDGTVLAGPFPAEDGPPHWSPGGGWLAMQHCGEGGGCGGAVIMRPDGSQRHELAGMPIWSPGDRFVAVAEADGTLTVGNGDGTNLRSIGAFPRPTGWSPDGSSFVFVRDGDAWLAQADGSGVRNLTEFPLGGVTNAWWSPDGQWILVLQGSTMWAFSPDSSVRRRLGADLGPGDGSWGPDWLPAWSPNGEWVAVEHNDQVTLLHAGDWRRVSLGSAWQPAWSLDGRHLAIVSDKGNGSYQVEVTNPDGSGRVTVSNAISYPPVAWFR